MQGKGLLHFAEGERAAALGRIDMRYQAKLGQFFTPAPTAEFIALMAKLPSKGVLRVLDPGAGSGMLSAALVARILRERSELKVDIMAIECDSTTVPHLEATLCECEAAGQGRVTTQVIQADFIFDSTGLAPRLDLENRFDLVIENPPYGKLGTSSPYRKALRATGIDIPNLYAAFLSLSVAALKQHGQLVAITPRSFFNGPYFSAFRSQFLNSLALKRIHVFDSRATLFADADVLQENVILSGTRNGTQDQVKLSISRDHTDKVQARTVPYNDVVFPNDPHKFIRLNTHEEDTATAEFVLSLPCTLADLGIQVSTGRVVDFRSRHALSDVELPGTSPLVYPGNLRNGRIAWPRTIRKPQWFNPLNPKDHKLLMPEGWYTVVKRFTSKEESRRIVASSWSPAEYPGPVAFENHLNVFHANGRGLDKDLAKGLALWLNSSLIENFFRTFSGHTQVNATDLRSLRFPELAALRDLGRTETMTQNELDRLVMKRVSK